MSDRKGIEHQIVESWQEWDQLDTFTMMFMDCVLLHHVAVMVGSDFAESVVINTEASSVQIYLDENNYVEFELKVSLGDMIK
jgi:hypothetical protein